MSQTSSSDIITLNDIIKRIPPIMLKMPHILRGMTYAFDPRTKKPTGLGWAFEKAAKANPNGAAVVCEERKLSYRELNEWANQIAHFLLSKNIQKGDVIAVMVENRPELLASVIATAKIGAVAAMVNTSQRGKVLAYSINLVQPKFVIAGEEVQDAISEVMADLALNNKPLWFADTDTQANNGNAPDNFNNLAQLIRAFPLYNPNTTQHVYGQDGLFYVYTSGTTGMPKAVIFKNSRWMKAYGTFGHILDLGPKDVLYATLPLYHSTGMVVAWSAVIVGTSTFALRRKFSSSEFWKDVQKYQVTAFAYVGELCRYLLDAPPGPLDRAHNVRKMVGNGLRPNIWGKFKQRFGVTECFEFYGSSEGNVGFSNIFNFENTVGFSPVPYAIVEFDKDAGEPIRGSNGLMNKVEVGASGLLLGKITNSSPFDGYTDPEKSKAVIFENVLEQGDRYFNTGDLVRDIGFRHAQFVDRVGDTFRWKGENVSTCEVENILSDHPKVSEAVVYGVEIADTNGRAGMSVLIANHDEVITPEDYAGILAYARANIPAYAVPVFLRLQQKLETTGTFKYQKNTLKNEGFDPNKTSDTLLVWLPGTETYVKLTPELYKDIQSSQYRF